jgi:hypothetical protein
MFVWVFLFYNAMSGRGFNIYDSVNASLLSKGMILTLLGLMLIMLVDRVFYTLGIEWQTQKDDTQVDDSE